MSNFSVKYNATVFFSVTVEAETEDQAQELVEGLGAVYPGSEIDDINDITAEEIICMEQDCHCS